MRIDILNTRKNRVQAIKQHLENINNNPVRIWQATDLLNRINAAIAYAQQTNGKFSNLFN